MKINSRFKNVPALVPTNLDEELKTKKAWQIYALIITVLLVALSLQTGKLMLDLDSTRQELTECQE